MNMQTPATAPSNRFVKLSILHRDKGKSPGVPKLKNRTVKSQHYLNYQISLAVQIPRVKLSRALEKKKKSKRKRYICLRNWGPASEKQTGGGESDFNSHGDSTAI